MLAFHVLGPLEVRDRDGIVVPVVRRKQRELLLLLLLRSGGVVRTEEVVDALWGERPPSSARANLYSYVSALRSVLARAAPTERPRPLLTPHGYRLDLLPGECDTQIFDNLVDDGRRALAAGRRMEAADRLTRALSLWRGGVVQGMDRQLWLMPFADRLEQTRAEAEEDLIEARLLLGQHAELAVELAASVAQHPLRERLWGQYILALWRSGRRAVALRTYDSFCEHLRSELGVGPSPSLRELYRRIRSEADPVSGSWSVPLVIPRQIPADVASFAGRADCLERLDVLLNELETTPTVVIAAITGTAGVGKTALAVHWAHRVAGRFPGGLLYLNLRGFDAAVTALRPVEALPTLLEGLGVPPRSVPGGFDAQIGLYRSLLAVRRVLVVLDNALDAEQVRPLVPTTAGCMALVTSRSRLSGLVASEGAHPLAIDLLTTAEARQMLALRIGPDRIYAHHEAVDEIIRACCRLPVALAVVAARAAGYRHFGLGAVAAQLRDASSVLDASGEDDPLTDIRTVFSWSYRTLCPPTARLFRLLGVHPSVDFTLRAAASLSGVGPASARTSLSELARSNLIMETAPGRYAMHDLLRTYAAELADEMEPAAERDAAVRRALDHYLHTVHAADRLLRPERRAIVLEPAPDACPEQLTDRRSALTWLTAEYRGLLAAIRHAAGGCHPGYGWRLAWALESFFDWRGHWAELAEAQHHALGAATRAGDAMGQANVHHGIARSKTRMCRYDEALGHLATALRLFRDLADEVGQATIECSIGYVLALLGRHEEALSHDLRSLDLFRSCGDTVGQTKLLNNVGYQYGLLGEYELALDHCQQALTLNDQTGAHEYDAQALDSLGFVHSRLGNHRDAIRCYRMAISRLVAVGDRIGAAYAFTNLGDVYEASADPASARSAWRRALKIFNDLHHPRSEPIHARLEARLSQTQPAGAD
nr:BTAD domain-containing putative transcriptional regulator [Micromonospora sp. DSM 115978]